MQRLFGIIFPSGVSLLHGSSAMKPDTSRWSASSPYDFMDQAGVDDLAWECLRRNRDYQQDYAGLRRNKSLDLPVPEDMERRWGLRFRGPAAPVRL